MCFFPPGKIASPPDACLDVMRSLDRRARFPDVLGAPRGTVEGLGAIHLLLVGAGSVGMVVAAQAGRLGLAGLRVCDRGRVKAESVLTHPVSPADIGRAKASLAAERAEATSPGTRVFAHDGPFEGLSASVLASADVVILASDNLKCEISVTRACSELGVPLIQASVFGPALVGQVRSLANPADAAGPCLACGLGSLEWDALDRGTRFSCEGGPASEWAADPSRVPTLSLPQLCALTGNLAVMELTRRALGIGDPSRSSLIEYRGFDHVMTTTRLDRKASCPLPHAPTRRVLWARDFGQTRLGELLGAAGWEHPTADAVVEVEGFCWSERAFCACPAHPPLGRFLRVDADPRASAPGEDSGAPGEDRGEDPSARGEGARPACAGCGGSQVPHPFYTHRRVPASLLASHLDRTLAELGAATPGSVRLRRGKDSRLFHRPLADGSSVSSAGGAMTPRTP